jgi:hypothetical protein
MSFVDRNSVGLFYKYFLYYSSVFDKRGVGQQREKEIWDVSLLLLPAGNTFMERQRVTSRLEDPLAKIMTA